MLLDGLLLVLAAVFLLLTFAGYITALPMALICWALWESRGRAKENPGEGEIPTPGNNKICKRYDERLQK